MVNDDERPDEPSTGETEPAGAVAAPAPRPPRERVASHRTVARQDRRDRLASRRRRRNLLVGIGGGTIAAMLIIGLVLPSIGTVATPATPAQQPDDSPLAGTEVAEQPGGFIEPGTAHAAYATAPPTSGPRFAEPAAWGVHDQQAADETVVRNLEVGGIVFNYNLESDDQVADLRELVAALPGYPGCYLVQPHDAVPAGSVTLTAWTRTQQIEGVDRFLIQTFAADHRNQGPQFLDNACGASAEPETDEEPDDAPADEPDDTPADEPDEVQP